MWSSLCVFQVLHFPVPHFQRLQLHSITLTLQYRPGVMIFLLISVVVAQKKKTHSCNFCTELSFRMFIARVTMLQGVSSERDKTKNVKNRLS